MILLLFVVGLELNPQQVIQSGKHVLITGFGQYILCVLFGLGFFLLMGYNLTKQDMGALYLALLCAMSSTAIVAKLLFDKFHKMVTGNRGGTSDPIGLGKLEVFCGVSEFPVRVKCASLAWHTLNAALDGKGETVPTK